MRNKALSESCLLLVELLVCRSNKSTLRRQWERNKILVTVCYWTCNAYIALIVTNWSGWMMLRCAVLCRSELCFYIDSDYTENIVGWTSTIYIYIYILQTHTRRARKRDSKIWIKHVRRPCGLMLNWSHSECCNRIIFVEWMKHWGACVISDFKSVNLLYHTVGVCCAVLCFAVYCAWSKLACKTIAITNTTVAERAWKHEPWAECVPPAWNCMRNAMYLMQKTRESENDVCWMPKAKHMLFCSMDVGGFICAFYNKCMS